MQRRTSVLTAISLILTTSLPLGAQGTPGPYIRRSEVAERVHVFADTVSGAVNSVAIITDDGVVLFDAGSRPSRERVVLAELRRLTSKPLRLVINSHWHPDHWSGNEVYADSFPGVDIGATAQSRQIMEHVAPSWPAIYARTASGSAFAREMMQVRRVLPTLTFSDSLTLFRGGRELRLVSLDGDAVGSAVLYMPKERVVLTGDLLVHPVTWTTNSFRIRPWIASLEAVRALRPTIIVPGHGTVFRDTAYLDSVIELFTTAERQVHAALARGLVGADEVRAAVDLEPLRARFTRGVPKRDADFDATVDALVRKVYQESRDGMESRR